MMIHVWSKMQTSSKPLELCISIQLISNLLQTLCKLLVVWVTQLTSAQLRPRHYSVFIPMSLNTLVYETLQLDEQRQKV